MRVCVLVVLAAVVSVCQSAYQRYQAISTTTTPLPLPTVLVSRAPAVDLATMPPAPEVCLEDASDMAPLARLRTAMRNVSLAQGMQQQHPLYAAFVVFYTDEHLSEEPEAYERRLQYISGWDGTGTAAVLLTGGAALWVPSGDIKRARAVVSCSWIVLDADDPSVPTIADWISERLSSTPGVRPNAHVGGDGRLAAVAEWQNLQGALQRSGYQLLHEPNLVDQLWDKDRNRVRPEESRVVSLEHELALSGVSWRDKLSMVRSELRALGADAMVVTALDEVAWLLNVRGRDVPYAPLLKAFVVIGPRDVSIYAPEGKVSMPVRGALDVYQCYTNCTKIVNYQYIYTDLRRAANEWSKILIPSPGTFHRGASAAIAQSIPHQKRLFQTSPITYFKAQKNAAEIQGMKIAHLKDAVAMCTLLHYLENHLRSGLDEMQVAVKVDETRITQRGYIGPSVKTQVAFAANGANADYLAITDTNKRVFANSTLIIRSGGQYKEGTTLLARTVHYGVPRPEEKRAYTTALKSLSAFTTLSPPASLPASHADVAARAPVWARKQDYAHPTGHGVGAALNVREDPVVLDYRQDTNLHTLREGYFITIEPAWYVSRKFGVRLGNIIEVIAAAGNFLNFKETTLVPYEPRLIDKDLLTENEVKWLNAYNARIRSVVGAELQTQGLVDVYYWMTNKTVPLESVPRVRKFNNAAGGMKIAGGVIALCFMMVLA